MAPIKLERLASVSSEDEAYPATNLLKTDYSNKKWKCKTPGEKQISAVFQMNEPLKITSIDVGNEHSAFIEVLVGKSCLPDDDYKVLLVTSSLMSLQEAKYSTNVNGVNFFKKESLCKPICDEKWDRIKVVCSQPFNKDVQYGLSFIVFHTDNDTSKTINAVQLGNCQSKNSTSVEPLLKAGGLFANRNKLSSDSPIRGAAAIRAASTSADVKLNFTTKVSANSSNNNISVQSPININSNEGKQKKKTVTPKNEDKDTKKKNGLNGNADPSTSTKTSPGAKKKVRAVVQTFKKKEERPFGNLLTGVVFGISGYENPLRSELRNKALSMGARYEANWSSNCTHLICAFRNTPKYSQVRGQGKIIKKEWIEECYSRRMRLPWRRFALDRNDASQPESEEEIYEEIERSASVKRRASSDSSHDYDTDEEIERVRQKQKKQNHCKPSTSGASTSRSDDMVVDDESNLVEDSSSKKPLNNSNSLKDVNKVDKDINSQSTVEEENESVSKKEVSVYDMDTEEEDENYPINNKTEDSTLPPLPNLFQGATIALLDDLSESDRKSLKRYIKAHQGNIANDDTDLNTILYAITEDAAAIERVRNDFPQVIGVSPEWIWRSHDEGKLLPASMFTVTH